MTEFRVDKLIEIANSAIANLQADLDRHAERVAEYQRRHAMAWERDNLPKLRAVRDALTAALKKGGPIHLHHSLKTDSLLYSKPSITGYDTERQIGKPVNGSRQGVQERIDELRTVVATLEAQTGETINANQLRLVGITKLGDLFRSASIVKESK